MKDKQLLSLQVEMLFVKLSLFNKQCLSAIASIFQDVLYF